MGIVDRTWFNTLVNDDGTGLTGTPWDLSAVGNLLAAVDISVFIPTTQTTTSTGTQNNFATTASRYLRLRCNNASLLTFTGFSVGVDGDLLEVVSVGAGQVDFANDNSSSSAANRIQNMATTGPTSLSPGRGAALFIYDATAARWVLVQHEQGGWISPAYAAGNFTAATGTWTVDSGDVESYSYYLRARTMTVQWAIGTSSVSATPSSLRIAIPAGFSIARNMYAVAWVNDNGAKTTGLVDESGTLIRITRTDLANFATATNTTGVYGEIVFEVS